MANMMQAWVVSDPGPVSGPLLCAGLIRYRSILRAQLPPGGVLGIFGFGASTHLTAQLAIAQGAEGHVLTRGQEARELALHLGAVSAGGPLDDAPVPLDAAISFAPVPFEPADQTLRDLAEGRVRGAAGHTMSWARQPEPDRIPDRRPQAWVLSDVRPAR